MDEHRVFSISKDQSPPELHGKKEGSPGFLMCSQVSRSQRDKGSSPEIALQAFRLS